MGSPEDKVKRHRRRKNTFRDLYKRKDYNSHTSQERLQKDHTPNEVYDRKINKIDHKRLQQED